MSLRRICNPPFLDKTTDRNQLYPLIIGVVEFNYVLSHLSAADLSISDRGVLKSPTIILDSFISPCDFISFC